MRDELANDDLQQLAPVVRLGNDATARFSPVDEVARVPVAAAV